MKSRGRQGLLPYFRIEIPEQRLAEQERSIIMLNLRLEFSPVGAKAQEQAAKIRLWVRREEEMRAEASRAHWLANIRGRGIIGG